MMAELRRQANNAAQEALRNMVAYHSRHGVWNQYLVSRYHAAERLLDMVDEQIEAQQSADPAAPDYFGIFTSEAEARAAFGDK